MLSRLETMVLSGAHLPVEVVRKQMCSAIDLIIHLARMKDRSRKVLDISEVLEVSNGEIVLNPLFRLDETTGRLLPTGNPLRRVTKLRMAGFSDEGREVANH